LRDDFDYNRPQSAAWYQGWVDARTVIFTVDLGRVGYRTAPAIERISTARYDFDVDTRQLLDYIDGAWAALEVML
jgi:hypothetical protein